MYVSERSYEAPANRRGPVVVVWSQGAGLSDIYARLLTPR